MPRRRAMGGAFKSTARCEVELHLSIAEVAMSEEHSRTILSKNSFSLASILATLLLVGIASLAPTAVSGEPIWKEKLANVEEGIKFWESQIAMLKKEQKQLNAILDQPNNVVLGIYDIRGIPRITYEDQRRLRESIALAVLIETRTESQWSPGASEGLYINYAEVIARMKERQRELLSDYLARSRRLKVEADSAISKLAERIRRGEEVVSGLRKERSYLTIGAPQAVDHYLKILGNVWDVTEVDPGKKTWKGTWVRIPRTQTFKASWKVNGREVARDVTITVKSIDKRTNKIVIERSGLGEYYGILNPGRGVSRGTASWYPKGKNWSWTATIRMN